MERTKPLKPLATIIKCDEIVVKQSPDVNSADICEIPAGKNVVLDSRNAGNGYARIEYLPGLFGYVLSKNLKMPKRGE